MKVYACHGALRDPPRCPLGLLLGAARLAPAGRHAGEGARARDRSTATGPADPSLTVDALAERLRGAPRARARAARAGRLGRRRRRRRRARRALAAGAPRRRCSTRPRPARSTPSPTRRSCLRSFAMYTGARRGRSTVDAAAERRPRPARRHPRGGRERAGILREGTTPEVLRAPVLPARSRRGARSRADLLLHAFRAAADGREGRHEPRPRRASRSGGSASAASSCWPAAATTTRCSPNAAPRPCTSRCCSAAGWLRRLYAAA